MLVELGKRRVLGVVIELEVALGDLAPDKLKPVLAVVPEAPALPEELLEFLLELARYYVAPIGEVLRLALPAVERGAQEQLRRQGVELRGVGRLVQVARAREGAAPVGLRGATEELWRALLEQGPQPLTALEARWKGARRSVQRLVALGAVELERQAPRGRFDAELPARDVPPALTDAQAAAVAALTQALDEGRPQPFLLQGVTASGKTEIYLHAAAHAAALGRGAIVLVPEIALTPQLVARFRARLGDAVAVLHSGLSPGERHHMWSQLRRGQLRVVVGARSALFAPVERLGLLCVDEEHDGSFKQEEGVRYHARDMALLRGARAGACVVLGTATPSLASAALVAAGRLRALRLPARATQTAALPKVELVDLRRVGPAPGGERLLSVTLYRALEQTLSQGEQAILFLNRRGFAPNLVCGACGDLSECPSCSVPLTLHRAQGARLLCHFCDHQAPPPSRCPRCGAGELLEEGAGTERIVEALERCFPSARVARLDRDVAAGVKSEGVLRRMHAREIDVLVGTQMVTKGHDLPHVTLVGVLNADAALGMPDFRAAERAFHLLVQVAGRAGRGERPGRVLIQTRQPEHRALQLAVRHDVDGFIEAELVDRRELGYPPYTHLALVRVDAVVEAEAAREAARLAELARAVGGAEVLGPAPAPLARLRGRFRYRFLLRAKLRQQLRPALLACARQLTPGGVRVSWDVDPMSML